MEQLTSERLHDNLQRLKLGRAAEVLGAIARAADGLYPGTVLAGLRLHDP